MQKTENNTEPKLRIDSVSSEELKRNTFKTPPDYFDNLTPRIMQSVRNSKETKTTALFSWNRLLFPTIGIAVVLFASWFILKPTDNSTLNFEAVIATLSIEELTEFADLQPIELLEYELIDYKLAFAENNLTEDEIIQYLETENEFELNTIVDELEI